MKYNDRVYGEFEIRKPVVLEILKTPTFQRLKGIKQFAYFIPYFSGADHTRFEHSVGVYLLLRKYKASIEEQLAGLIHDVSHAVFSHVIDYVLPTGSEKEHTHQDDIFEEFVRNSEIPSILKKYSFDLDFILDDKNFPLKERELPNLCADRIDYSLRDAVVCKELGREGVNYFLENLTVTDSSWVFKTFEVAKKYSELFLKINLKYYCGLPTALMFRTVGDYLKYALKKRYIEEVDLYTTDVEVLSKIATHLNGDRNLKIFFARMNKKVKASNNPKDFDVHVFCKSRVVDPLCFHKGEIKRISDLDKDWKLILEEQSKPKEYFIKFGT